MQVLGLVVTRRSELTSTENKIGFARAGIVRHSQTKGRATGNAKPSLKPANGRCGYKRKRNSGRCGARSRIGARYSRTGSEQKVPDRHHRAATLVGSKRPTGGGRPRRNLRAASIRGVECRNTS